MSIHFFGYSVFDTIEDNQPMKKLSGLVEKANHTVVNLIRLLEKLPLSSPNDRTEHASVEQQKIYQALCQTVIKLDTLSSARLTKNRPFLQNNSADKDDDTGDASLTP
jgi:hypothetical protein